LVSIEADRHDDAAAGPVIKELLAAKTTAITRGSTMENRGNLAPSFLKQIRPATRAHGSAAGAECRSPYDNPNALWNREMIERATIAKDKLPN